MGTANADVVVSVAVAPHVEGGAAAGAASDVVDAAPLIRWAVVAVLLCLCCAGGLVAAMCVVRWKRSRGGKKYSQFNDGGMGGGGMQMSVYD